METVEQRLVRMMREQLAPHAASPEVQKALRPLLPLAEETVKAAQEREDRIATQDELLAHAGRDAETARLALNGERAVTARLEEKVSSARTEADDLRRQLDAALREVGALRYRLGETAVKSAEVPRAYQDPGPTPNPDAVFPGVQAAAQAEPAALQGSQRLTQEMIGSAGGPPVSPADDHEARVAGAGAGKRARRGRSA